MPGEEIEYSWDEDVASYIASLESEPPMNTSPQIQQVQAVPNTGGGILDQIATNHQVYQEMTYQMIHDALITELQQPTQSTNNNWASDYWSSNYNPFDRKRSEKSKNYINDDVDMNKVSEDRDMVVLTSEEIKKAVCETNPQSVLFAELSKNSNLSALKWPLGSVLRGSFNPYQENNSSYIVLGHIIDNKVFNNHFDSRTALHANKSASKGYVLFNIENGKILAKDENIVHKVLLDANQSNCNQVLARLEYRIINTQLSGKVFGLAKTKASMTDLVTSIIIHRGSSTKLGQDTYYAIIFDKLSNRNIKYCLSDLEVVLPNILGYNFPKDKTIVNNSKVILKENPNTVYTVKAVYENPTSKRISKRGLTRQLDVLTIVNIENIYDDKKVYAKNVKLL